jgi:hypothetical protein
MPHMKNQHTAWKDREQNAISSEDKLSNLLRVIFVLWRERASGRHRPQPIQRVVQAFNPALRGRWRLRVNPILSLGNFLFRRFREFNAILRHVCLLAPCPA